MFQTTHQESSTRKAIQTGPRPNPPVQMGNQAMLCRLQAKLAVSQPGDSAELEADRVADRVMRMASLGMPAPELLHKCTKCESEESVHPEMASSQLDSTGAEVENVLKSPGRPLEGSVRAFMEPRIGFDLSGVRVHTDSTASESARAINALAYACGDNIVFQSGQYAPATTPGKQLLAHELAHVGQQRNAAGQSATRLGTDAGIPEQKTSMVLQRAPATDETDELLKMTPTARKKPSPHDRSTKAMIAQLLEKPTKKDFDPKDVDTRLPDPDDHLNRGYVLQGRSQKFGRIEAIDAFTHIAYEWAKLHSDIPISVNAISKEGGGPLQFRSGTGSHTSHTIGLDFDISLHDARGNNLTNIRENPNGTVTYISGGNASLSREFAKFIRDHSPLVVTHIFFNDPNASTEHASGHNDHFHVRFTYTQ